MNGKHQFLVYADDVRAMGDNVSTIRKNNSCFKDW
jgi:hypothetical protein